jgi:hypothetical protein
VDLEGLLVVTALVRFVEVLLGSRVSCLPEVLPRLLVDIAMLLFALSLDARGRCHAGCVDGVGM